MKEKNEATQDEKTVDVKAVEVKRLVICTATHCVDAVPTFDNFVCARNTYSLEGVDPNGKGCIRCI